MRRIIERIKNEPAILTAVILAVANVFDRDLSSHVLVLESIVVLAAGVVLRHFVTPTRTVNPESAIENR